MPYSCGLVTVSLSAQITGCILARLIQASAFVVSFLVASHFRLTAPLLYILRAVHRRSRIATLLTIARGASNRSMKPLSSLTGHWSGPTGRQVRDPGSSGFWLDQERPLVRSGR